LKELQIQGVSWSSAKIRHLFINLYLRFDVRHRKYLFMERVAMPVPLSCLTSMEELDLASKKSLSCLLKSKNPGSNFSSATHWQGY
jgi:hypothetical protein